MLTYALHQLKIILSLKSVDYGNQNNPSTIPCYIFSFLQNACVLQCIPTNKYFSLAFVKKQCK